jgi:8-oxo-dGTP pyrophosphatase MutT (NUDIX family)
MAMRTRLSARLLIVNDAGRLLLFRFVYKTGPLAGQDFWATPGGGVEDGEAFEQTAVRELAEETGLQRNSVGPEVARREFLQQLPDGERVMADERYFLVRVTDEPLSRTNWTALEREVMVEHRWWSREELARTEATVWPEKLLEMLEAAGR